MNILKIFSNKIFSKDIASDRLKLILIHDRADISPDFLEMIKSDILQVISKYAEIETGDIEVRLTTTDEYEGNSPALIANIPIKKIKR
ncbi:cell division topological specificity factor MinE [Clostridium estertheticum]|uniref:cell division topological specificity factor MinE n=1 Tax=Clostridium estertheticum TaxID=238834 RepID=UPI001C0AA3AE|nr:cell division topological specificity factor MinE [Clostridium estertheticum]MBU3216592.1 cell division topological specificity factor MinE [Clostridium estertheticum]MBW9152109.1 cell division topological specificity factor MinE [Clostridium estertheticum]MCB2359844.1 cell division topological specificity factor MinE [Clostridium estertheticum]WAG54527.1 cell division topological specificity factor MinE [Clostridium estertheticum]WLC85135.1 cell division topological specificity factor MinE